MDRLGGAIGLSRRTFMQRAGLFGAALATVDLAALLDAHGLLDEAAAQSPDLTHDTLNGLVAFIVPGDDAYSAAQGQAAAGPGGIAAGAVEALIHGLDHYVPLASLPGGNGVPASGGVAMLLNQYALQVNPAATGGGFPSAFSRLSFDEKAQVFQRFESDSSADATELRFVAGILPGFVAFLSYSETGVRDLATGELKARAIGWDIAGYAGPAEGHAELRGYWHGHRSAKKPRRRRKGH
jgi:hypothetical protein